MVIHRFAGGQSVISSQMGISCRMKPDISSTYLFTLFHFIYRSPVGTLRHPVPASGVAD